MEVWRTVTGYEGYYEVSNTGRVRSVDREIVRSDGIKQVRRGKEKAAIRTPDGYFVVKLSKDGFDRRYGIHYLVAREFVDGYEDGLEVNHKDYNRTNNYDWNLEWVTHEQNIQHTLNGGRHITQNRDMSGVSNPNYGNRKLSEKYASDKELSREKQSRPGSQNGRARAVIMISPSGDEREFSCLKECAEYLVNHNIVRGRDLTSISTYISRAASNSSSYFKYKFRFQ